MFIAGHQGCHCYKQPFINPCTQHQKLITLHLKLRTLLKPKSNSLSRWYTVVFLVLLWRADPFQVTFDFIHSQLIFRPHCKKQRNKRFKL